MEINIGKLIKELRKDNELTQSQLADKLCTTQDTISLWELGKSYPDIFAIKKIAILFNVSSDYLLGLED